MLNQLKYASVIALIALAGPAVAQDDTAATDVPANEEATPQAAAPEATPVEGLGLDMGDPVAAEPQVGEPYIREVFGDWALRCLRAEPGEPDPCQLYQLLRDEDGNPVAEVSIVPLPPGSEAVAGAVIVVPLETQLSARLTLSVDGGEGRRYEYDFCNRAGCVARFGLSQAQVDQFKRGAAGQVRIVPAMAPDQQVLLRMSLTGFTAGYNATTAEPTPQ